MQRIGWQRRNEQKSCRRQKVKQLQAANKRTGDNAKKLQADNAMLQEQLAELREQLDLNGSAASDYNNRNNGGHSNGAK